MTSNQPWWLTWAPEEVAATILPLFAYPQLSPASETLSIYNIAQWCKTGTLEHKLVYKRGDPFMDPDSRAIAEAVQVLEHARLLMRCIFGEGWSVSSIGLTRLGWHAVQTNTVRQHLGLGAAPPAT
jgi:hypothetical protein